MLTSDLLVTRIHNGKIEPVYAPPDQENLENLLKKSGTLRRLTIA
jgi:predicted nuclease of restriction endonuclease-like RecB superfamily